MANYREKYTLDFRNLVKQQVKVSVLGRAYKRLSSQIFGNANPASIEYTEVGSRDNGLDKFKAIRGSGYNLGAIADKNFSLSKSLYSEDDRAFQIQESLNGTPNWKGYLSPYLSREDYKVLPYELSATALDGLTNLSSFYFVDKDGHGFTGAMTALSVIVACLSLIGLEIELVTACNVYAKGMDESLDPLTQTYVQPLRFVGDDDEPKKADEVLRAVLESFGLVIFQSENAWWVVSQDALANSETIKTFRYAYDGTFITQSTVNLLTEVYNADGNPDETVVRADNPATEKVPSARIVTFETEYGNLANRLYNGRFRVLDPTIQGGQIARGWRQYNSTYSYVEPNPAPVFQDYYLRIDGKFGVLDRLYPGIEMVWGGPNFTMGPPYASVQTPFALYDKTLHISAPIIARFDQMVSISGEFFQVAAKGIKIQVVAVPLLNEEKVNQVKINPYTSFVRSDEKHDNPLFLTQNGEWLSTNFGAARNADTLLFENTKEVSVPVTVNGDKYIHKAQTAKLEWGKFSIESEALPRENPYGGEYSNYYTIRIVLFRAVSYEAPFPLDYKNDAYVMYRNLFMSVRNAVEVEDIRKERVMLQQPKPAGRNLSVQTLQLGSVGGDNYYSQLLDQYTNPQTLWYRTTEPTLRPLAQVVATQWLNQYRKASLKFEGSLIGDDMAMNRVYRFEGIPEVRGFMCHGAKFDRKFGAAALTLAELLAGNAAHSFKRWTVDANGKANLIESGEVEGNIPDTEADILITFLEPNGPNGYTITPTGSAVFGSYPAHWATFAWFDKLDEGPYTVTVQSLTYGQGFLDYQKVYPAIDHQFQEIEIPQGIEVYAIVTNASGATSKRKVLADYQQKLHISTPGTACQGDYPAVTGVLQNYSQNLRLFGKIVYTEEYEADIVDLMTGDTIEKIKFTTANGSFAAQVSNKDWKTKNYGLRIRGTLKGDRAGNIVQITRCIPLEPNFYGTQYGKRYKKQEVIG